MLKIGDFSKLSRVSIRMLRHYDEIGLLHPVQTDPISGYRYYQAGQLSIAGRITALREMGFGLAEIGQILSEPEDSARLLQHVGSRLSRAGSAERRLEAHPIPDRVPINPDTGPALF